jgi:hypothetical protein
MDSSGNPIYSVNVFDPTMPQGQQNYAVEWRYIVGIFVFGQEDTYGLPGYFGYGEGSGFESEYGGYSGYSGYDVVSYDGYNWYWA